MLKLSLDAFQNIRTWIYRNARPLELAIWQQLFENGSADAVRDALLFYRNEDGGFGNALEPDNWSPCSTPYTSVYAVELLARAGLLSKDSELVRGLVSYFADTPDSSDNGWFFSSPSNSPWPHAPWWEYNKDSNALHMPGVSCKVAAFLIEHAPEGSPIRERALHIAGYSIGLLGERDNFGDDGITGYLLLAQALDRCGLGELMGASVRDRLAELVTGTIEHDVEKWAFYGIRPSNYILAPDSPYYTANAAIVEAELDYLISTKPADSPWDINWTWFDNMAQYAAQFAISENWWKSIKAIEKLVFLRSFGRLELPAN